MLTCLLSWFDCFYFFFFFSSRRRHTRCSRDWSSDVCSSDLGRSRAVTELAECSPPSPTAPARGRSRPPLTAFDRLLPPFSSRSLHDRRTDEVTPLGPRPVVVANLLLAQQVLEREPGVARPLADAAVGDDLVLAVDHLALVELQQLFVGLERTVGRHRLAPGDAARSC